tara:strand:- start:396 stop:977 length:582 start_codon:yes stop_codon:yes gene_type:complete
VDSVYNFVVKPLKNRYNNTKLFGNTELVVNTEIFSHEHVSREAVVTSLPKVGKTKIKVGDVVLLHHNVFRRWHNQNGVEKNSRSYFDEQTYLVSVDQIFMYKNNNTWKPQQGYCFVKPVKSDSKYDISKEKPLVGIVKYTDGTVEKGDLIGFRPNSEYEFIIDGEKLYRVLSNFITIKYEYQGNEEEYNPSWA